MKFRLTLAPLLTGVLFISACNNKKTEQPSTSAENQTQTSSAPEHTADAAAAPTPVPPAPVPPPAEPSEAKKSAESSAPKKSVEAPKVHSKTAEVGQAATTAPPHPPQPIVIPSGTLLIVRLEQALSSKSNHQGDRFVASLARPLVLQGKTIAPIGAPVSGTVTAAQPAGQFKGGASLNLQLDTLVLQGSKYQIQTTAVSQTSKSKGKRSATMIGGGTGAGALIGGVAGGGKGAAIGAIVGAGAGTAGAGLTGNNNDINLPVETALSFEMKSALTIQPTQSNPQAHE